MADFWHRIGTPPRPHNPSRADDVLWSLDLTPPQRALLAGIAGSSPYLCRTLRKDPSVLSLLDGPPEAALRQLIAGMREDARAAGDQRSLMTVLRRAKTRAAFLIALCDIGGVWDFDPVTDALSDLADASLDTAIDWLLRREVERGMLDLDAEAPSAGSGLAVLAMGKHGARELNYSSDIDIVLFFDPERWGAERYAAVKDRFNRLTRDLVKVMAEITEHGYVFRTDLRLRPDPGSTPLCMDMDAAERYYESLGKTWERAAFIKARACAGDIGAGLDFLERLQPFVWRRYLDFAAIEDIQGMKRLIHQHKGHGAIKIAGHDLKLGRGGIREIEFFAQTQQLISGGRNPALREPTTLGALRALTEGGWVREDTRAALEDAYKTLRRIEHRIQMIEDAQTHDVPKDAEGIERLALFLGHDNRAAFETALMPVLKRVSAEFDALFETERSLKKQAPADEADALQGFADPQAVSRVIAAWSEGRIPATRSERSRRKLERLMPTILSRIGAAASPDQALMQFDRFLSGLPGGVQLFSLFESNPTLLELVMDICGAAPRLATYMARNAVVLDAVLSPGFFDGLPPAAALERELEALLAQQGDYEAVLDAARRWAKERQFQIGVQILRGLADAAETGPAHTAIAEAVIRALAPYAQAEVARVHGPPPGAGAVVVGMGKLGAREMTANSDLDLLVIYDPGEASASTGPKPLAPTHYYARWTQKLVAAITAPTAEGAVYEVDMRLRPSGRAGPLATAIDAFRRYQAEDAWTWERMALTRARVIAGDPAVTTRVDTAIAEALSTPRAAETIRADALDMRRRLDEAHAADLGNPWRFKTTRGGMMDIDFIVQTALLISGSASPATVNGNAALALLKYDGVLPPAEVAILTEASALHHALMQIERVALNQPFEPETAAPALRQAMMRAAEVDSFEQLETRLRAVQARVRALFEARIGAP